MTILPCTPQQRAASIEQATTVLSTGGLVVLPTDTVYGIAADAFDADAVAALLAAKGRGRQMPPPVLVATPAMLDVLAVDVAPAARALAEAFWPGALTIIVRAQPTLTWDLGETAGTVALRMPDHEVALDLLRATGPLAVSSANRTGAPAATTAQGAKDQLGARVAGYLDDGEAPGGQPSTIVDATGPRLRIVRDGAIDRARLAAVVPHLGEVEEAAQVEEVEEVDVVDVVDGEATDEPAASDEARDGDAGQPG
ncbi:L-threonylcarbamoyladenylate synthase [Litorihabitans aurantiacus]|uniref:L-threonylcarbamoyladenylate synthase n=1 Tax=Litorihabitans aurantiacus TaxID=1930061 RepID=A0AA37XB61_9MICO|nr:L-threonylcarbamoyladenylate synthase [Litorihabitans aurantiacus]GMA30689.1 hypothetical protein GCM10025875_06810 [Litorihabitans aurantiacus]